MSDNRPDHVGTDDVERDAPGGGVRESGTSGEGYTGETGVGTAGGSSGPGPVDEPEDE